MFIQHSDIDRPGLLGETLGGMGLPLEVIRPDLGQMVPDSLDGFAGLALGGGPQGAYEQGKYPYLSNECALVPAASPRQAGYRIMLGRSAQRQPLAWGSARTYDRLLRGDPGSHFSMTLFGVGSRKIRCHCWRGDVSRSRLGYATRVIGPHPEPALSLLSRTLRPAISPGNDSGCSGGCREAHRLLIESGVDAEMIWQQGQQCLPVLDSVHSL